MDRELNIGIISSIQNAIEEYNMARATLEELSEPLVTDWDMIPSLYELFLATFTNRDNKFDVDFRKRFFFVILFLFCPRVLAGERMPGGFRKVLAKTVHIDSGTTISDNCSGLMFIYDNNRPFRRDVGIFYAKVVEYIEKDEEAI